MKIRLIIFLFFNLLLTEMKSQGYLGSHFYSSVEVLHPIIGEPELQLNLGIPFKRYYALEFQLHYLSKPISIMNRCAYKDAQNNYASEEYRAGKVRLNGTGLRLSIKNFKKASLKAAPIGWYMSSAFEFWEGSINSKLNVRSNGHYDGVSGQFVYSVTPTPFMAIVKTVSILLSPGRSFVFYKKYFLDISLDMGIRFSVSDNLSSTGSGGDFYPESPIYQNKINAKYMYKFNNSIFEEGLFQPIYEPNIKIGYIF